MSGFYNGVTSLLMEWALGEKPADVGIYLIAVDDSYVFDPAHGEPQITGSLFESPIEVTLDGSTVKADELTLTELTPGDTLQGFVFLFTWVGGERPICFINQATDLNLPFTIVASELTVKFAAQGIFKV